MKYVYKPGHPKASKFGFVAITDLENFQAESLAVNAPILSGRFYENTSATDGTDIGSRRKHREYMRSRNLAMASDFTNEWKSADKERLAIRTGGIDKKARREAVERAVHKLYKP